VTAPADDVAPCRLTLTELDFTTKTERSLALPEAKAAIAAGRFVWIDVALGGALESRAVLQSLALVEDEIIEGILGEGPPLEYARYDRFIKLVVSGTRPRADGFSLERLDLIVAETFIITSHRGPLELLTAVLRDYRNDFVRFAKSPSFLVYEILDHLLESYLATQHVLGERVERLQNELSAGVVDDGAFVRISELGADLLHFRKLLLPARALLSDLSTRRSLFLSEATQRFLGNMVGTVEHLIEDLLVDREILSDSLNLYMSVTSHRTNQVMKRLTVLSFFFLPLTFLVGVYGMNFRVLPELEWRYGYLYFWGVAAASVAGILYLMRRTRML
jgi:magnesium transporter